jgi:hypothetical protein
MNFAVARAENMRISGLKAMGIWLTGLCVLVPAGYLFVHGQMRILIALMCLGALLMSWILDRTMSIVVTFSFLLILGDIRRITDMIAPSYAGLDLLLVVAPVFAIYLAVPLLLRLKVDDKLSKAVLALMAIMLLEIFNPRQGGIAVGVGGAMFFVIPILWFWIARNYATDRMMFSLFYRVFLPIGILDGLLGVAQAYIGFFPWEKAWAIKLGSQYTFSAGHMRSFGFSTGASEFASTLLISGICVMAAIFAGRRAYVLLIPILLAASVLSSSRGLIVKLLFGGAMIWAVRSKGGRNWVPRLVIALVVGAGLIWYSASHAGGDEPAPPLTKSTTAQIATEHVTQGLANPLEAKSSTAGVHWQIFVGGIVKGFTYPIGTGIGAITLAAGKFTSGALNTASSEVDISDVFTTMGFFGGFLYLYIIYLVFRMAFFYIREGTAIMSLAYIGLFASLIGAWIALGQYSTAPFVWFCIGSLVRKQSLRRAALQSKSPVARRAHGPTHFHRTARLGLRHHPRDESCNFNRPPSQ